MTNRRRSIKTLYDELEGTYAPVIREEILHSMTVVTQFGPHISDKTIAEKFLLSILPQVKRPYNITGLLLTYPKHAVMILEAPLCSLQCVVRELYQSEKILKRAIEAYKTVNYIPKDDEDASIEEEPDDVIINKMLRNPQSVPVIQSRILCMIHDADFRIFRAFESKIFDMELVTLPDKSDSKSDEKKLIELLQQLTRLSVYLVDSAMKDLEEYVPEIYKMRMIKLLNNLREDHPELVPQQPDIGYFAEVSAMEGILSADDYLSFYEKSNDIVFHKDLPWPAPVNNFLCD